MNISRPKVMSLHSKGFTIVELLIVIVVIAILAAVTVVAYTGMRARAEEAKFEADVKSIATILGMENSTEGRYPSSLSAANNNKGIPSIEGVAYEYSYQSATNRYCLTAYNTLGSVANYFISSDNTVPKKGQCPGHPTSPGGSMGTIHTIHGDAAPGPFGSYSDAQVGKWVVHQYYVPYTGPSLESARIIGARLYVPPDSSHIGRSWRAVLIIRTGPDAIITSTSGPINPGGYAQFEGNESLSEGAPLVAGWNEVLYPEEYPGVDNGEAFLVGVQIGDGTHYLYNTTINHDSIPATGGANFVLAEHDKRGFYDGNHVGNPLRSYGIDVIVRTP